MNPVVVDDPHPRGVPELIEHVAAQVITDTVDIPVRGAQQPLHPVRRPRTSVLGQRPAVLALQTREQPTQIGTHPPTRLDPTEPARDQLHHRIQRRDPPSKIHHAEIITAGRASASHDTPNCRCSINRRRWKTRIELANAIFEYLEIWHNRRRRHSALGWLSPLEFETRSKIVAA